MANFGQMLAAAQAFVTPEQQRILARSESKTAEYEVEEEKKKQIKKLQEEMEAAIKAASEEEGKFGGFGKIGKLLSFLSPVAGAGVQALSGASQAEAQRKALKGISGDARFSKYGGTWLSDPTEQYQKDVSRLAEDIDPWKTGLTTGVSGLLSGKIASGIGKKVGGMFKGTGGVDAGGPLKNLFANIKSGGGIGGGGLEGLFEGFNLMDILGEAGDTENLQALPYLMQLFTDEGGRTEFDPSSYFN